MNIAVIGTGYVGLVQGTCFAETGNNVTCMDIDEKKIAQLKKGTSPIYEPGLEELVKKNIKEGRLHFTTVIKNAVESSDVIFLCLPTPPSEDGSADLTHVLEVAKHVGKYINGYKILVSKSTVPVGTVDRIKKLIKDVSKYPIDVVSSPEFLKEGAAVNDSLKPDRIIIGTRSKKAIDVLRTLYEPFVRTGNPILIMDERSAEMTKYASNAFLATKISFMNDLANLCEKVGADIDQIRRGMGSDPRIGKQFLFSGVGYGGSCFPKDVKALVKTAHENDYELKILESVDAVNENQKSIIFRKLKWYFNGELRGKTICIWGLSFKPQTDDIREAPSLVLINRLLEAGAIIRAHDPVANRSVRTLYDRKIGIFENAYEALKGADALAVITEWNEFRVPDFDRMISSMKRPVIFDGRNIYDPKMMKEKGFEYFGIGRGVKG